MFFDVQDSEDEVVEKKPTEEEALEEVYFLVLCDCHIMLRIFNSGFGFLFLFLLYRRRVQPEARRRPARQLSSWE
jgi:hypothetical protein